MNPANHFLGRTEFLLHTDNNWNPEFDEGFQFHHGVIKLSSHHEVDGLRGVEGLLGECHGLGSDKADLDPGDFILEPFRQEGVVFQGGRTGVNDDQLEVAGLADDLLDGLVRRRFPILPPGGLPCFFSKVVMVRWLSCRG